MQCTDLTGEHIRNISLPKVVLTNTLGARFSCVCFLSGPEQFAHQAF